MKNEVRPVADERIQKAWTKLSACFFYILAAVLLAMGALCWTQTGCWYTALPEMIGLAVGLGAAAFSLTAGKAWRGRDEAVSERRWISLHASFFLMNWTAYLAIFIAAFVDRAHSSWYLLSMLAAAVVYFARRILAARSGLILYKTPEQRKRGDRRFLWASIGLGVFTGAVTLVPFALLGGMGWLPLVIAAVIGTLMGWLFWRYYRWLIRMSEKAADQELAEAEGGAADEE